MTERGPDRDDRSLDHLRRAWATVRPRSVDPGDLEPGDAATRAAVDWMRAAWGTLEAPAARVPEGRLRVLPRRRWRRAAALAAGLLALAAVGAFLQRSGDGVRPEDEHRVAEPGPAAAVASPPGPVSDPADGPRVVSLGPDHLELRSGPVRLILFQEPIREN